MIEDENIRVKITRVGGDDPRYDAWSIDAQVWIDDSGEKKFEKKIALNVLKDNGELEKDDDDIPHVVHRIKDSYKNVLKEDPEYNKFNVQSLEDEKSKVKELEGGKFEV